MSTQEERDNAHKIIREAMERAGIVDGFYGGVFLSGKDVSSFRVGIPDRSTYDNVERYQRVVSMMESLKHQLMKHQLIKSAHESQEDEFKP